MTTELYRGYTIEHRYEIPNPNKWEVKRGLAHIGLYLTAEKARAAIDEIADPLVTLQESHDALARQVAVLLGQTVYGHHGINRMQVLMAAADLAKAVPLQASANSGLPHVTQPSKEWVEALIAKASAA